MIRPSSMPRVAACPGSLQMAKKCLQKPPRDLTAANEGTEAARIAADVLLGAEVADMPPELNTYIDHCKSLPGYVSVEQPLEADFTRGTPDHLCYNHTSSTLIVTDLKWGYGWVEPEENWQLITYALLWWANNNYHLPETVALYIVQPRASHPSGPVRRWSFPGQLLRNYYNQFMSIMAEAEGDNPRTTPGSHCRYCPAILDCKSARKHAADAMEATVTDYSGVDIAWELESLEAAIKTLQHRLTAAQEQAVFEMQQGRPVPGYEVRQKVSALKWKGDAIAYGQMMGVDLRKPPEPITPTQAIKRKILTEDRVKVMAAREMGGFEAKKVNLKQAQEIIKNATK